MLRLVMRSTALEARIRSRLPALREAVPALRVVTINVQPEHKAVLEGEREIVLTDESTLPMRLATGVTLRLGPRSFFQTNTFVAEALYDQARAWVDGLPTSRTIWDLYCGVGGFALHLAATGPRGARGRGVGRRDRRGDRDGGRAGRGRRVRRRGRDGVRPGLGHARPTSWSSTRRGAASAPSSRAGWRRRASRHVVYSSCNAESLARDLALMPSLRPVEARVLDMFPHTTHYEVIVLLSR